MDSHHQHPASETGVLLIELQGKEYPTEQLKMVSAAGLAPAIPRSQAECVGCYATRCSPRRFVKKPPGSCFLWRRRTRSLMQVPGQDWRTRRELHPQPSRRQRGALLIELRVNKWWEVLVMLQFVASDFILRHLIFTDRQSDHFPVIASGHGSFTAVMITDWFTENMLVYYVPRPHSSAMPPVIGILIIAWIGLIAFQAWLRFSPRRKRRRALIDAIERGDLTATKEVVASGLLLNFNYWSELSWSSIGSPLSLALAKRERSLADFLIANGASLSPKSPGNEALLTNAV